jgi:hypothetical protein
VIGMVNSKNPQAFETGVFFSELCILNYRTVSSRDHFHFQNAKSKNKKTIVYCRDGPER